jgi:hypothetical protein
MPTIPTEKSEAKSPVRKTSWRSSLGRGDEAELLKWIEASGVERVARIVTILADSGGRPGQPAKPEIGLLVKIADLMRQVPQPSLHSVARQVALKALPARKPTVALESLASKLERDFRERRHVWFNLARRNLPIDIQGAKERLNSTQVSNEYRVLSRLIELLPGAIDLFDLLVEQATDPEKRKVLTLLGRSRVEPLVESAMHRLLGPESDIPRSRSRSLAERLAELIEPDLMRLKEARKRERKSRPRGAGRKPRQLNPMQG